MLINQISHHFPAFTLDVANITLAANQIIGLVGANGSGKTTLMSLLAGFSKANGVFDVTAYNQEEIMFIPTYVGVYDMLSVYDFVELVSTYSKKKVDPVVVLEQLQLTDKKDEKLIMLSEGMRKKLTLVPLFTTDYKFVILDEPFNSIDMNYVYELKQQLRLLRKTTTILISSHILDTLNDLCDTFIYIKDGSIVKIFANTEKNVLEQELFSDESLLQSNN